MENFTVAGYHCERLIGNIEVTSDRLTGHADPAPFSRYLRNIDPPLL